MAEKLKIVIVEDHLGFCEAFSFYLEKKLGCEVFYVAHNAQEIYDFKQLFYADIIFMDVELPDDNGINIAKKLLIDDPSLKIIAMTLYEDNVYLTQMITAGFKAALFKSNFYEHLKEAIEMVNNGRVYFPENIKL